MSSMYDDMKNPGNRQSLNLLIMSALCLFDLIELHFLSLKPSFDDYKI